MQIWNELRQLYKKDLQSLIPLRLKAYINIFTLIYPHPLCSTAEFFFFFLLSSNNYCNWVCGGWIGCNFHSYVTYYEPILFIHIINLAERHFILCIRITNERWITGARLAGKHYEKNKIIRQFKFWHVDKKEREKNSFSYSIVMVTAFLF